MTITVASELCSSIAAISYTENGGSLQRYLLSETRTAIQHIVGRCCQKMQGGQDPRVDKYKKMIFECKVFPNEWVKNSRVHPRSTVGFISIRAALLLNNEQKTMR